MRSTKGNGRVQHIILLCPSEPPPEEKKPEKIHEDVSKRAVWIEGVEFSQLACDAIAISTPGDPRGKKQQPESYRTRRQQNVGNGRWAHKMGQDLA